MVLKIKPNPRLDFKGCIFIRNNIIFKEDSPIVYVYLIREIKFKLKKILLVEVVEGDNDG